MKISIPYGDNLCQVEVPDRRLLGVLAPAAAASADGTRLIREAVAAPAGGSPPLSQFARPGEPVLVIVNDATRPTPTAAMLASVWEEISAWDLSFLVATGTHRAPAGGELRRIFGGLWDRIQGRVSIHDARDEGSLLKVGVTSAGNEIRLNRAAVAAAKILVLSSVEAHYFAGYTGGRKIVLPGISGYDTIERNHRLAMDPGARVLTLAGNPVHRDMDEALGLLTERDGGPELFAVLAVLDREKRINMAAAGGIREAFRQAAAAVDRLFSVTPAARAEIVVAAMAPPLDIDFYQAQKAVENGKELLKEGGILIVISACRTGVGNEAFLDLMRRAGSPEAVIAAAAKDYRLGYHKAARLARVVSRSELWSVVGVDDRVARDAFMRPFSGVSEAVAAALAARPGGQLWVLEDAGVTVPRISE